MKKQSLVAFFKTLSDTEKGELLRLLKSQEVPNVVLKSIRQEVSKDSAITCPKCQSQSIIGHGQYHNRKRYMCKECHNTFNKSKSIAMARFKKPDKFQQSVELLIDHDNILCSDSHPSIIAWMQEKQIEHHTFIANKQKVKDKVYHVQYVNSLDNLLERWLMKFFGISSKYLQNYLIWFVLLQNTKNAKDILIIFAKQIIISNNAINSFKNIPQKYKELITLQY